MKAAERALGPVCRIPDAWRFLHRNLSPAQRAEAVERGMQNLLARVNFRRLAFEFRRKEFQDQVDRAVLMTRGGISKL